MTDKARELLEQVIAEADSSHFYSSEIDKEIRAYLAEPTQDEEPVAWMLISTVGSRHYHMSEQQALKGLQLYGGKVIALYEHPAPRTKFVRLSEDEIDAAQLKYEEQFGPESRHCFTYAVRFAEKHHGIGGGDE